MIRDEFPIFQSTLIENRASYVIFLFNYFMYRIFDLSNYGNEIIRTEKLEELMFLRYSIFALNFVNTINIALHHLSDPDKMMEIFRKQLDDKLQRLQSLQLKKSKFSLINGIQPSDKIIDKEKIDFNEVSIIH